MTKKETGRKLSHIDKAGSARMVDVSEKPVTFRTAVAESVIRVKPETIKLISKGRLPKGNAIETARVAGIMAAKRTAELIPMCHPLALNHVDVVAEPFGEGIRFRSTVTCAGRTGVEMEALTAVSVAALTLYDMVKAVEKGATIENIRLISKTK